MKQGCMLTLKGLFYFVAGMMLAGSLRHYGSADLWMLAIALLANVLAIRLLVRLGRLAFRKDYRELRVQDLELVGLVPGGIQVPVNPRVVFAAHFAAYALGALFVLLA